MPQNKRIVITGMGLNSPLGDNKEDFYNNLMAGKSGIRKMSSMDTSAVRCKIGGDLGNYDFKQKLCDLQEKLPENISQKLRKILKISPFPTKITTLAGIDAFLDSNLKDGDFNPAKMCAILGGHNFNAHYLYKNICQFQEEPEFISPLMGICCYDSDLIACLAEILGIHGPMYTVGGTCTSSGLALRSAINEIKFNDYDLALVGGGCLDYSPIAYQALIMLGAISYVTFNDSPERASRPYDTAREGFVPSHGSGMLIIEELEHALKRNARIYAEILAVETSNDANHLSNPSIEGQSKLMQKTVSKACLKPENIDYINAHATSTPLGDIIEIQSINKVFANHAKDIKINATKSMIGHTGWTAHSVELIASILQMQHNSLHPSINIDNLDSEVNLDVCANQKIENHEITYILKNSFGFGGINCCSILKKWKN